MSISELNEHFKSGKIHLLPDYDLKPLARMQASHLSYLASIVFYGFIENKSGINFIICIYFIKKYNHQELISRKVIQETLNVIKMY